jgi:hypothetical protein
MHEFEQVRHWLFLQIHPGNWFGNIVAGIVVYFFITLCWQWFLKKWVKKGLAKIHAEALAKHHRDVVKPEADAHHEEHVTLAKRHHAERMAQADIHHKETIDIAVHHHARQMKALSITPPPQPRNAKGHFVKMDK